LCNYAFFLFQSNHDYFAITFVFSDSFNRFLCPYFCTHSPVSFFLSFFLSPAQSDRLPYPAGISAACSSRFPLRRPAALAQAAAAAAAAAAKTSEK
jgi:hypothetical protein